MKRIFPASVYNPITLTGAAIASVSFGLILFLILIEIFSKHQKPYMGIIAFVILPGFLILGLLLIAAGMIREHYREKAEKPPELRLPRIDLNDTRHRRAFILFLISTIFLLMLTAFGSFKAYEYTDSDRFCGELCHKVMEPEYVAFKFSPHARVGCVQCHIGPGADWFVRSKLSGTYQVYSTILNKYPRPIPTPIENLRPAQETCEQCHWPKHFFSEKQRVSKYFFSDEQNTWWTLNMLIKVGGGSIETGPTSGIHWHMNIANEIIYTSLDAQRMKIPIVSSKGLDGKVTVYRSTEIKVTDEEMQKARKRRMDCIDCHNRPTHIYHQPAQSVDQAMALGWIDVQLPNIKTISVKTLEGTYKTRKEALDSIKHMIEEYYQKNYPKIPAEKIEKAIQEVQKIYSRNYFPEMVVSWKKFSDHIGHMYSPGCFRCHDGKHVSDDGKVISKDCKICHVILSQQFKNEKLRVSVNGIEFRHPVDIGDEWKEMNCSDCHSGQ